MRLPTTVGAWTRAAAPQTITARNIFDYMDGAGELYLAYRFDRLDVIEYSAPALGSIVVELYWMQTSDDAFGLLSGDWSGEAVNLAQAPAAAAGGTAVPPHRALYGAGLLRIWADQVYARVLASKETAASRKAVLELGRAIAARGGSPAPPRLLSALPRSAGPGLGLRADRVWFLRSHLVLNSAYFLATENILNLDSSTEVAVAPYAGGLPGEGPNSAQLILARYAGVERARQALARFREAYLPDMRKVPPPPGSAESGLLRIEEGWIGYRLAGRSLALVLGGSTSDVARVLLERAVRNLESLEGDSDG